MYNWLSKRVSKKERSVYLFAVPVMFKVSIPQGNRKAKRSSSEGALKSTEKRLENDIDLIKNLKLTKLSIDAQKLDFEDNTFDYIVALSVLSLLGDINRINCLLSEFKRITKIGGKLILDINDHDSEFSAGKKQIDENVFLLDPNEENMKCYCLKNEEAFKSMLEKFFEIKDIGFSAHKVFGRRINEWLACAVNK